MSALKLFSKCNYYVVCINLYMKCKLLRLEANSLSVQVTQAYRIFSLA